VHTHTVSKPPHACHHLHASAYVCVCVCVCVHVARLSAVSQHQTVNVYTHTQTHTHTVSEPPHACQYLHASACVCAHHAFECRPTTSNCKCVHTHTHTHRVSWPPHARHHPRQWSHSAACSQWHRGWCFWGKCVRSSRGGPHGRVSVACGCARVCVFACACASTRACACVIASGRYKVVHVYCVCVISASIRR
jgi:hypothetical protein